MCRQGVVNTRQSGVFVAHFTRLFCSNVGGSVSLSSAHQVLVRHVGNVLACFMSAEGQGLWGWQLCASSHAPFGTPRQGDYGVLLTRTNCLKCEVRANSVGFPFWMVEKIFSAVCPVPFETLCDFTLQSSWLFLIGFWIHVVPLLCINFLWKHFKLKIGSNTISIYIWWALPNSTVRSTPFWIKTQTGGWLFINLLVLELSKIWFWKHFKWKIDNAVTQYWFIFDQHCLVLQFEFCEQCAFFFFPTLSSEWHAHFGFGLRF